MTAVTKKFEWDFHLPPKANTCVKFQLSRLLGGLARECDGRTDARTDGRTPGEYSANSGPAGLVPGPELSNYVENFFVEGILLSLELKQEDFIVQLK